MVFLFTNNFVGLHNIPGKLLTSRKCRTDELWKWCLSPFSISLCHISPKMQVLHHKARPLWIIWKYTILQGDTKLRYYFATKVREKTYKKAQESTSVNAVLHKKFYREIKLRAVKVWRQEKKIVQKFDIEFNKRCVRDPTHLKVSFFWHLTVKIYMNK